MGRFLDAQMGRGWALTQLARSGPANRLVATREAGPKGSPFYGYSLRTPRDRYNEWDEGREGRELYDPDVDPQELANLAADPSHAATVAELSRTLSAAVKTTLPPDGVVPEVKPVLWTPKLPSP